MPASPPDITPGLALSLESSYFGFFAHAGFAASLLHHGIRPGFFAGASSGSMIATLLGAGFTSEEIKEIIFDPRFKWSFWELKSFARGIAMMFCWPGVSGLTSAQDARKYLTRVLLERAPVLEACRHGEVSVTVANLHKLRTEILTTGDSASAILASCAFPCLVSPQPVGEELCWDGGVANSSPFLHYADDERVDTIITHHIHHPSVGDRWTQPGFRPRIADTFSRGHLLITADIHRLHLLLMEKSGKRILPVTTTTERPGLISGRAVQQRCYDLGWKSGESFAEGYLSPPR
jgi:NTE family protein